MPAVPAVGLFRHLDPESRRFPRQRLGLFGQISRGTQLAGRLPQIAGQLDAGADRDPSITACSPPASSRRPGTLSIILRKERRGASFLLLRRSRPVFATPRPPQPSGGFSS